MSSGQFFDGHASKEKLGPAGGSASHEVFSKSGEAKSMGVLIVGVDNMGGGMVANLLSKGWQVMVSDIDTPKVDFWVSKGALDQSLPGQEAPDLIATIICVVDAAQTEDVLFGRQGLAHRLKAGQTVILCPTILPQDVEGFARRLAERGIHTIDAPMSGGPARATDGTMSLLVACPPDVFVQQSALLNALSSKVFNISDKPGDAARTKLVNNLLAGINLVGAAEALALAEKLGLDVAKTLSVIEQSSGQSWIGTDRMRRAMAGDYAPRAHVTLLEKDTRMALECAAAAGFDGPLGAAASGVFQQAHRAGLAAEDEAAVFKVLSGRG
jgi:3-hydroxyisobutyrate dehydrogenase